MGAEVDQEDVAAIPLIVLNLILIQVAGAIIGTIVGCFSNAIYFKSAMRAMLMYQNSFFLPTVIAQEACQSYGFLAGQVINLPSQEFIPL